LGLSKTRIALAEFSVASNRRFVLRAPELPNEGMIDALNGAAAVATLRGIVLG